MNAPVGLEHDAGVFLIGVYGIGKIARMSETSAFCKLRRK